MNAALPAAPLPALSIGELFPAESFFTVVHSAFHSAINFRYQDRLLTLVAADQADLPQGVRVDAPADFSFERFKAGDQVLYDGGLLRLGSLTVDLRGVRRWKCDLPALTADLSKPAVLHAWRIAWQALNERQQAARADILAAELLCPGGDAQNMTRQRAGDAMRKLFDSSRKATDLNLEAPLHALIGLGSGLTPSGDDLLVGFLAGLWCGVHQTPERQQLIDALSEEIARLAYRTNEISRAYLLCAAHGKVSSHLAKLASAICRAYSKKRLLAAFESAVQVGHSSGMDAVTGLLFGLGVDLHNEVNLHR